MSTDPTGSTGRSDDWMFNQATLGARAALVGRLVDLPQIADAYVTCDGAPLQIEGHLADGRSYYFRARWAIASLSIADVGERASGPTATTVSTSCSETIVTECLSETVHLFTELLASHNL